MTKRVNELKRGDRFILWGKEKRVTSVNGRVNYIDVDNYWADSLPAGSMQKVEVLELRCGPDGPNSGASVTPLNVDNKIW